MKSDIMLLNALSAMGYSPDEIRAAKDAVAKVDGERLAKIAASIDTSTLLSPLQASAQSKRHAAELKQLSGQIFAASRGTYKLPMDGSHINIAEVNAAIRNAPIEIRHESSLGHVLARLDPAMIPMSKQNAKRPAILTDVYGRTPPEAAKFGVGAHVPVAKFGKGAPRAPEVEQATDARRNAPVGKTEYADRNR